MISDDVFQIAEVLTVMPFFLAFCLIVYDILQKKGYMRFNPLSHSGSSAKGCWKRCRRKLYDFNGRWIDKIMTGDEQRVVTFFPSKQMDLVDSDGEIVVSSDDDEMMLKKM